MSVKILCQGILYVSVSNLINGDLKLIDAIDWSLHVSEKVVAILKVNVLV